MSRLLAAALVATTLVASPIAAAEWAVQPEASTLSFTATQTGTQFSGQFTSFSAAITLDPADTAGASISVVIDTSSFNSGASDRDASAREGDWFAVDMFPEARFVSEQVTQVEGNSYLAVGTLTIKGVAQPLELPFTLAVEGDRAVADGTVTLDRTAFGVGTGEWDDDEVFIGFKVDVSFHIEAVAAP